MSRIKLPESLLKTLSEGRLLKTVFDTETAGLAHAHGAVNDAVLTATHENSFSAGGVKSDDDIGSKSGTDLEAAIAKVTRLMEQIDLDRVRADFPDLVFYPFSEEPPGVDLDDIILPPGQG